MAKPKKVYTEKYFVSHPHPISVILVGCGGNGSQLLQQLARINHVLLKLGHPGIKLAAIDPDIVTEANYGRQLFNENDIGKNKAVVLIERINRFYGFGWFGHEEDATAPDVSLSSNIIITCVDSFKTREKIAEKIKETIYYEFEQDKKLYWIDLGNDKNSGQIIMKSLKNKSMPGLFDLFPEKLNSRLPRKKDSCSVAEAIERQDLMVNSFMALVASKMIWEFLKTGQINWHGAFINTETLNIKKLFIN